MNTPFRYYIILGCFTYPTYYDGETGTCVETCPVGTYGAVSGTSSDLTTDRARNCLPSKMTENLYSIELLLIFAHTIFSLA